MLRLKPGVRVVGVRQEIVLAITIAHSVFAAHGYTCTVTSIVDGQHSAKSLHYPGCAFDARTRHLADGLAETIANELSEALGVDYDVVLEPTHLHIEFQPPKLIG